MYTVFPKKSWNVLANKQSFPAKAAHSPGKMQGNTYLPIWHLSEALPEELKACLVQGSDRLGEIPALQWCFQMSEDCPAQPIILGRGARPSKDRLAGHGVLGSHTCSISLLRYTCLYVLGSLRSILPLV